MWNFNDLKYLFLGSRGFTGALLDRWFKYLNNQKAVNDAEYDKLSEEGFTSLSLQEKRIHKLSYYGFTGAYPDSLQKYLRENLSPVTGLFWEGGVWGGPTGIAVFEFDVWGS